MFDEKFLISVISCFIGIVLDRLLHHRYMSLNIPSKLNDIMKKISEIDVNEQKADTHINDINISEDALKKFFISKYEKVFTIIGGVNGVGKSSLTGVLLEENIDLGIIIDADKITAETGGDRIKGGKIAIERIENCLEKGVNFTQETTLSGVRTLKTIQKARELNYFIRLYYVGVNSSAESISRIRNRVSKGGHDIPAKDVERRYNKRFEDLAKVLSYCDEAVFFDNENGFSEKAEYKNGSLITKGENIPEWIKEFDEYLK